MFNINTARIKDHLFSEMKRQFDLIQQPVSTDDSGDLVDPEDPYVPQIFLRYTPNGTEGRHGIDPITILIMYPLTTFIARTCLPTKICWSLSKAWASSHPVSGLENCSRTANVASSSTHHSFPTSKRPRSLVGRSSSATPTIPSRTSNRSRKEPAHSMSSVFGRISLCKFLFKQIFLLTHCYDWFYFTYTSSHVMTKKISPSKAESVMIAAFSAGTWSTLYLFDNNSKTMNNCRDSIS